MAVVAHRSLSEWWAHHRRDDRRESVVRVLITGIGGELGTRVASLLEHDVAIDAILGVDVEEPKRAIAGVKFHRVDPRNRIRTGDVVRRFAPTAVLHVGTYEPDARSNPKSSIERTAAGSIAALGAAADAGALDRIVVRSGIEIYGRRDPASLLPDEATPVDPTTPWGHSLRHAEMIAREAGTSVGGRSVPVTLLRFAPIAGPGFPSPLGRVLVQRVVPFAALADPPFSLVHPDDAAAAFVAALHRPFDGPVNVVGEGSITASRAALKGHRVPLPVCNLGWRTARTLAAMSGAPIADHLHEVLTKGRMADGSRVTDRLGWSPRFTTADVIDQLYGAPAVAEVVPMPNVA
jgi:UDP-glucose 4-epimerase